MREIGAVLWVVLLVVGVVGSMVSSIRRQRGTAAPPPRPSPVRIPQSVMPPQAVRVPPAAAAPPPRSSAAPARAAASATADLPPHKPAATWRRFGDRNDLVRAVIAAEVLGKPRALRDEYFEA